MKILLVYTGFTVREVPLNILYVSAALKKAGHATRVFELTPYKKRPVFGDRNRIIKTAFHEAFKEFRPDLVGFSAMTINLNLTRELAGIVKSHADTPVIFGGVHPTVEPEGTISMPEVDMVCVGEGEKAMVELADRMEARKDFRDIKSIWVKDNGEICRNPIMPLDDSIDEIPFPDRDAFAPEYYRAELTGANLMTGRGCPYPCSFCQNKFFLEVYKGHGSFIRYRSFENIFQEIEQVIDKYKTERFYFSDETFTMNKERVIDFCREYKKHFKNPFMCQTRVDCLDEDIVASLKEAGCDHVSLAIEAGNERIRTKVLKKSFKDDQIFKAFDLVKKYDMKTQSFNMIGIPEETKETIFETVNLNKSLQPDRILCTIYMPFKGTELGKRCIEEGLVLRPVEESSGYYSEVTIKNYYLKASTLIGYQGFFDWYVRLPQKYYWAIDAVRLVYQTILPTTQDVPGPVRYFREQVIEFVYNLKRFLPSSGYVIKNR
ncbi:MAG: radical SAM protein [Candidatus Brocadiales bacterium]